MLFWLRLCWFYILGHFSTNCYRLVDIPFYRSFFAFEVLIHFNYEYIYSISMLTSVRKVCVLLYNSNFPWKLAPNVWYSVHALSFGILVFGNRDAHEKIFKNLFNFFPLNPLMIFELKCISLWFLSTWVPGWD